MDDIAQLFVKSFTRYFIPGLITLIIAIYLPLFVFTDGQIFDKLKLFETGRIIIFSIVLGYLLDSFGAYSWILSYRSYKCERNELTDKLKTLIPSNHSKDPDQYLAQLWLLNNRVYNRLFVERAEWVMILETSSSLLLASVVLIVTKVVMLILNGSNNYSEFLLALVLIFLSYISSRKGMQRLRAHNMKVIQAIQSLSGKPNTPQVKLDNHNTKNDLDIHETSSSPGG